MWQNLVDMALSTSIQDESVSQFPLDLVSQVLQEVNQCHWFIVTWLSWFEKFVMVISLTIGLSGLEQNYVYQN